MSKRPELMAPAGSMDALKAALAAGADAVYLGGKQFNARQSAQNFGASELREAVRLAHRVGAKVYVTVNTLLKSVELPAAAAFLREIHNLGVDAAIVQDPGLIALARETTPQLELHASTQLTIHNLAGVRAMERLGISRVVLARELALPEIREIRQQSRLGLEAFLHGALCVAYSGQCLLSSLTGGRSGNRGQCAQICRLPYRLAGGPPGYLQSPKDLCLYRELPQLLGLGLDALKIEGRLKRPAYVAAVVSSYRQAIDCWLAGKTLPDWSDVQNDLLQAFNRGFTSGYFLGKPGSDLLTAETPGNLGLAVGKVQTNGKMELWHKLQPGDILRTGSGDELRIPPDGIPSSLAGLRIKPGQLIYRLQSARQEEWATDLVGSFTPSLVQVDWQVRLTAEMPLQLTASACGHAVQVSGDRLPEAAIKRAVDLDLLRRQLEKTGDSGFSSGELQADLADGLSIPVSEINLCRRRALDQLAELLWGQPEQLPAAVEMPQAPCLPGTRAQSRLAVAVADHASLAAALGLNPERIYYGAARHLFAEPAKTVHEYLIAKQQSEQAGATCYLRLPRIIHPDEEARWQAALAQAEVAGLYVSNWGGVSLARSLRLPFVLGTGMNAMNEFFLAAAPDAECAYLW